MTNEELAKAAQQGNQGALPQLWEATRALLFAFAWKFYTRQGKDCCAQRGVTLEDLQQEAFFALYDAVQAYKPEKGYQLTTYLNYATENRFRACMGIRGKRDPLNAADRLERPVPWDEEGLEEGDLLPDPAAQEALEAVDDAAQQEQLQAVLGEALEALPAPQGNVLRLRFACRKTRPETAQALGISPQEVRKAEQRALQLLRGKPAVLCLRDEILETAAYHGTGWFSWYFEQGSIEERLVESRKANR